MVHYTLIGHLVWLAIGFGAADYGRAFRGPLIVTLGSSGLALLGRWLALSMGLHAPAVLVLTLFPSASAAYLLTVRLPLGEMRGSVGDLRRCLPWSEPRRTAR